MAQRERPDTIQALLDRLASPDGSFDSIWEELVSHVYDRLYWMARKIFHEDFSRLEVEHGTGTVLHVSLMNLGKALRQVRPASTEEFFRFSAHKIRQTLLDLARKFRKSRANRRRVPRSDSEAGEAWDPPADQDLPERIAMWSEVHERAQLLPDSERRVFDLCFYHGMTQRQAAKLMGVDQTTVGRRLRRAIEKLPMPPLD